MSIDLSNFKVIYNNRVLRALTIHGYEFEDFKDHETQHKLTYMELVALNEEGQIVRIRDEAKKFQFLPVIN